MKAIPYGLLDKKQNLKRPGHVSKLLFIFEGIYKIIYLCFNIEKEGGGKDEEGNSNCSFSRNTY